MQFFQTKSLFWAYDFQACFLDFLKNLSATLFGDRLNLLGFLCKKELFEFLEDPPAKLHETYKILKIDWPKKFQYRA
ncbi:MAG: hypothetical protein ACKOAD_08615 [Gammaproteobacteria bacterium]